MIFDDTNLKLTLISEDIKSYYTVRQLELENLAVRPPALGHLGHLLVGLLLPDPMKRFPVSEPCAAHGLGVSRAHRAPTKCQGRPGGWESGAFPPQSSLPSSTSELRFWEETGFSSTSDLSLPGPPES